MVLFTDYCKSYGVRGVLVLHLTLYFEVWRFEMQVLCFFVEVFLLPARIKHC